MAADNTASAISPMPSEAGPLRLASGEVHCWSVRLDVSPEARARLEATLTGDERSRSARMRCERDRRRFAVARGALRQILGGYLGTHPGEIRFVSSAFGKPALSPAFGGRLRFNLSHSGDLALIAIAAGADVGVDVEYLRTPPDYAAIARRFFSAAEVDHLNGLPSQLQARAFFSSWTKKEAYLKACGEGLAGVDGEPHDSSPARHWSLYTLNPAPGYIGAAVIEGSGWSLTQRHWQMQ